MFSNYDINAEPVSYSFLGFGEAVTTNTVNKMIDTIKVSSKNSRIRNKAASIVAHLEGKDQYGEVSAVYHWQLAHTRYLKDPHGTEMITSPLTALDVIESGQLFQEDCETLTILFLSLLKSIGYPVALRIASYQPDGRFSHVYGLVNIYGKWKPVELIVWNKPLFWEAPNAQRIRDYKI